MEPSSRTHPNVPSQPTKPPDFDPFVVGQPTPAFHQPNTGLTPIQSGLTPQISPQIAATLGKAPSEAAPPSTGYGLAGSPPTDAPPPGDQFGGSILDQNLALADSRPGCAARVAPCPRSNP
ncbi:hypothetical protein Adt_07738 [Abeliophyllum distichum]|uniref:Uncharacterized protein n=1 Tax=Abeliophyllum distichum TaxID=126358 RepID=A0ABD1VAM0_9LAMI